MMKKLFYLLPLIAVLFITGCTEDKTNFLYGDVVDKETETPLEGCQVTLYDAQGKLLAVQQTGADGRWGFEVELGTYSLAFMKEGYEPLEESDIEIEYDHTLVKAITYLGTTDSEIKIEWTEIEEEPDVANGFAGGDGSKGNPYLIKNSGQLRLISEYGSKDVFFKLISDIDLNNKNWLPIASFSGNLDGNNHTIYNLLVERDECEYRGLIGKLNGGRISNLTVRGVKIYGSFSGTFVGYMTNGQITNCHVILENDSELMRGNCIGGIAGTCAYSDNYIKNCSVKSAVQDDKYRINGKQYVGGIVGDIKSYGSPSVEITNCLYQGNIIGEEYVGGIVGGSNIAYSCGAYITECLYQGNISGSSYVGGICGKNAYYNVEGCKVVADIECDGDYVGGIAGVGDVIACYAEGTITCENYSAEIVSGITNGSITLSYSAMQCTHAKFNYTGSYSQNMKYSYSIYDDIDDIAEKLQESYSEYCDYWNFDNCWTWSGTVNGKQRSVRCPRLAWEK